MFRKIFVSLLALVGLFSVVAFAEDFKLDVVLFTSPYCGHCQRLKREFLQDFKNTYKGRINLIEYDVTQPGNNVIFYDTLDEHNTDGKGVPAMVIGKTVLMGYPTQIKTESAAVIEKAIENKETTYYGTQAYIAQCKRTPPVKETKKEQPAKEDVTAAQIPAPEQVQIVSQAPQTPDEQTSEQPGASCENHPVLDGKSAAKALFERITLMAIIAAGLIDGINPCAFAVIVFFVSFLAAYKYNRREIILVGTAYCFSVFVAYVLIGLGLFNFLYAMRSFYYVMIGFKWLTVALCALFLVLSLYDFIIYTITKNHNKIVLQLSKSNKEYIHKVMRVFLKDKQSSSWRLVAAAVCVGFVVSLVEAVCTGQVYLPTIALILKESTAHFWRAMTYLLVYNLMFIVPLVLILVLSVLGYESSTFNGFFKKHLGLTKLLLCLLFLGLLLLLVFNM